LLASGRDLRALGGLRLATVGAKTADELRKYNLIADIFPDEFRAEALAAALAVAARGQRFLLARASRGREVLAEELTAAGGLVEQVVVYQSGDVTVPEEEIAQRLTAGQIDWVTVTSSAIAHALAAMFGDDLHNAKLTSISPVTTATLQELGYSSHAEAAEYTMDGVVAAILRRPK
jgi:uroporphyrinogen III methyltransferase/synthase